MNFEELKTELYARGTDYLSEDGEGVTRAERWLNQAYREISNLYPWPFLEATQTGPAPLTVPDLRRIRYVALTASPSTPLAYALEDELVGDGYDLTATGTPDWYYITTGSAVAVAPASTDSITVKYIKRPVRLTGTATPVFDEDYHNLIVDRAMIKVYQDSDNYDAAAVLREEFNAEIQAMVEDYEVNTRDLFYVSVDAYDG